MVIRRAYLDEYPQVIEFYYSVSDSMLDSPFRPTWRRGIYPVGDINVEYEGVGVKKFTLYEYLI